MLPEATVSVHMRCSQRAGRLRQQLNQQNTFRFSPYW